MNAHKEKISPKTLQWAFILSLVFHLFLIGFKYNYFKVVKHNPNSSQKRDNKIKIKIHTDHGQSTKITQKIKEKKRQIVDSEKSNLSLDTPPTKTRFLSENDQRVDREVVSRNIGPFKSAGRGEKEGSDRPSDSKKKNLSKKKRDISLADLSTATNINSHKTVKGEKFGKDNAIGQASRNDYIDDVPLGDMTKLNTLKFKYYGFYRRIKQRLEVYWGYEVRKKIEQLLKERRRPIKTESITALSIDLDHRGHIVDIRIKSASGVRELDEAAVKSFNKAGPFPNPPEGMLKNGLARIEWDFIVKT